jgi:hypothetical protein
MAHVHAISRTGLKSVDEEHKAWHDTREPCVFCGAVAWATCPVLIVTDGRTTGNPNISDHGRESLVRRYCEGSDR